MAKYVLILAQVLAHTNSCLHITGKIKLQAETFSLYIIKVYERYIIKVYERAYGEKSKWYSTHRLFRMDEMIFPFHLQKLR